MHPATPTFWIEPTTQIAWGLRRYASQHTGGFTCADGYHSALAYQGRAELALDQHSYDTHVPHTDNRWPDRCERCDYIFTDTDRWQDWWERIYRRYNGSDEYVLHPSAGADELAAPSAPPGAMWDATWYPTKGPDGITLMVRLPGNHDWNVDSQASNCTRPGEDHQCWVRHGDPKTEPMNVDKQGNTCQAGAGSIAVEGYHGFLVAGVLSPG